MAMEKFSMKRRRMNSAVTHQQMLDRIGGGPAVKFTAKDWAIRCALSWHSKARSSIRHLLNGEQKFTAQEERDVELGYLKHCADMIEGHRNADKQLFATIRSSLEYLERADPDFHRPAIQALGELADRLRGVAGEGRTEDRAEEG